MNESKTVNRNAKDVLAKVLAIENLTVIHSNKAKTAAFNPHTRTLILPIYDGKLKSETLNMFVGHEIGHALKSPDKAIEACNYISPKYPKVAKGYLNVVEDVRIERFVKNRYPGLCYDFRMGYQELMDRNFFGIKGRNINKMALVDRINIFFKVPYTDLGIVFTPEERVFVKKVQDADTWDEVCEVAKELYEFCKSQSETDKDESSEDGDECDESDDSSDDSSGDEPDDSEESGDEPGDESDESGNESSDDSSDDESGDDSCESGDDSDESGEDGDESSDEPGDGAGDGEGDESGEPSEDGESDKGKTTSKTAGKTPKQMKDEPAPECVTQSNFDEKSESLVDTKAQDNVYASVPTFDLSNVIISEKTVRSQFRDLYINRESERNNIVRLFDAFRKENKPKVDYLVMEFNRRKVAKDRQRVTESRIGMLNTSKLYAYKFDDNIFKTNVDVKLGKNHGLVCFIDFSGSMSANIASTVEQLLCKAMFCRALDIPFEAYGFGHGEAAIDNKTKYKDGDLVVSEKFCLTQLFATGMSLSEFRTVCINLFTLTQRRTYGLIPPCCALGSWTPLFETSLVAAQIVERMRETRKLEFVHTVFLTDGHGHYSPTMYNVHHTYTTKIILRENKSKMDFPLSGYDITSIGLQVLRYRTGSNVIGFYCTGKDINGTLLEVSSKVSNVKDKAELIKNNFITRTSMGYTEYYIIPGGDDLSTKSKTNLSGAMSKQQLADAMILRSTERKKNRVLLSRFIGLLQETV
jgi:hypothetical protein